MRSTCFNKIINFVKKDKCEECGNTENLEVHHDKQFVFILHEALEMLGLEYKEDTENYTEKELQLIKFVIQGMHIDEKMTTLCQSCHDKLHEQEGNKMVKPYIMNDEEWILKRNNEIPSVAQRIVSWFSENEGYGEIKIRDLLEQVGVTQRQFDEAKRNNKTFQKVMDKYKAEKRGYYQKVS